MCWVPMLGAGHLIKQAREKGSKPGAEAKALVNLILSQPVDRCLECLHLFLHAEHRTHILGSYP